MPKVKTVKKKRPGKGIHLYCTELTARDIRRGIKKRWYWNLIARNGRELIRSSETYNSKQAAVKSILATGRHFDNNQHYFDHTTKSAEKHGVADLIVYEIRD